MIIAPEKDYEPSVTEVDVRPIYVHEIKANLARGVFLGHLDVSSPVENAKIYLDEPPSPTAAIWGRTPTRAFVDAGRHKVYVEAPGYKLYEAEVDVGQGQIFPLRVVLERVSYGYLRLDSDIGRFSVTVGERLAGDYDWRQGPLKIQLEAGKHEIKVKTEGKKDYRGVVEVPAGQFLDAHVRFEDTFSYAPPVVLGVLAAGAGAGCAVSATYLQQANGQLVNETDPEERNNLRSRVSTFNSLTLVSGIGAGVLTLASLFFFIDFGSDSRIVLDKPREFGVEEPTKPQVRARLTPVVGPNAGGFVLGATF